LAWEDGTAEYATLEGHTLEHFGTDVEALAIANQVADKHPKARHVEAVSVGLPTVITDIPGRLLARIEERLDGKGWTLTGDRMPTLWYGKLTHTRSNTRRAAIVATSPRSGS
jgi:hypothetical protein